MKNNILNSMFSKQQLFAVPEAQNSLEACRGSNQSPLLVVYRKEENMASSLELLKKILSAIGFDIEKEVLLLEVTNSQPYSFTALRTNAAFRKVLILGVDAQQLGLHFDYQPYQLLQHADYTFLFGDALSSIGEKRERKAALWNALKQLFPPKST
ncbi:MAG: hypothetical protein AAGG75_13425 [Bacteroidota bacterium]